MTIRSTGNCNVSKNYELLPTLPTYLALLVKLNQTRNETVRRVVSFNACFNAAETEQDVVELRSSENGPCTG